MKTLMKCQNCKGRGILEISETARPNKYLACGLACGVCVGTGKVSFLVFVKQFIKLVDWTQYE